MSVSEANTSMTSLERQSVLTLCLLYMTRMLGLFMVLPVFAIYLAGYEGFTLATLGYALGIYGLTQALMQLPFGLVSDKLGRKPVIIFGLIIFFIGSVVAALADSVTGVIVGRALQGAGAIASTTMALVADVTRDESRSKAMAMVGASIGLSFALAMVLGPKIAALYGLPGVFWLTAGLALAGVLLVLFVVPTPKVTGFTEALPALGMIKRVLADKQLLRYDVGIFCLHIALTASFVVVPSLLETTMSLSPENHGFTYLIILGGAFVVMLPVMIMAEKKNLLKASFLAGITVMIIGALIMSIAFEQALLFIVAWFVFFVGFNLLEALLPSLLSRQVFPGGKGTAMGIYSSCQFMGIAVGGTVGGLVATSYGAAGVFLFVLLVLAIWLLAAIGMVPPLKAKTLIIEYNARFSASDLATEIRALLGVIDVVVLDDKLVAYVKVRANEFDPKSLNVFSNKATV